MPQGIRAMHRKFRYHGGMSQEFRRIVTRHDAEGKSIVVSAGPPAPIAEGCLGGASLNQEFK